MKLESKDLIVRTIISQIEEGEVDLEPDFQRGEVWNVPKQQMLIDTILRNWQMPPVFVVLSDVNEIKAVLDGHQRLTSIVNFCLNKFPINGEIQPYDEEINNLHGCYYFELSESVKRKFQNFAIRVFEISDYEESEPFELFFRLNQSVKLTSAERRNTFFGPVRGQVKQIVAHMESAGYGKDTIGFGNTRLSYHDVIARILFALEIGRVSTKISDVDITNRYRRDYGYSQNVCSRVEIALDFLISAIYQTGKIKLSKPSLFSMVCFFAEQPVPVYPECVDIFLSVYRDVLSEKDSLVQQGGVVDVWLLREYIYRLSTSVNDAKSTVLRRFFLYYIAFRAGVLGGHKIGAFEDTLSDISHAISYLTSDQVYEIIFNHGWGELN